MYLTELQRKVSIHVMSTKVCVCVHTLTKTCEILVQSHFKTREKHLSRVVLYFQFLYVLGLRRLTS